jgi:glycerophosphoryl diester phosphodiesterase
MRQLLSIWALGNTGSARQVFFKPILPKPSACTMSCGTSSAKKQGIIYDLYCGAGSIGIYINDLADKVVGVEYVDSAVKDAYENCKLNGLNHLSFYSGNLKDILKPEFVAREGPSRRHRHRSAARGHGRTCGATIVGNCCAAHRVCELQSGDTSARLAIAQREIRCFDFAAGRHVPADEPRGKCCFAGIAFGELSMKAAGKALVATMAIHRLLVCRWKFAQTQVACIAHRGGRGLAPENTLAAVRAGMKFNVEYLEIDVHQTADSVVVVSHDETLDRCTDGHGRIDQTTFSEIRKLDAGAWFGPEFQGEKIPTLAEVLDLVDGKHKLWIELKAGGDYPGIERRIVDLIHAKHAEEWAQVISFDTDALRNIHHLDSEIVVHQLLVSNLTLLPWYLGTKLYWGNPKKITSWMD